MREKKYANVLDDFEEVKDSKVENDKKGTLEEKEEKLSMTRELKFKEIQEYIDQEERKKEIVENKSSNDLDKMFENFISENGSSINVPLEFEDDLEDEEDEVDEPDIDEVEIREIKVSKNESIQEEVESKKNVEDIYLTTSFKPLKKRFKISKFFKVLLSLIFIAAVICAFVYYIAFPIYKKFIGSKPEMVFENTIKYVFNEVEQIYGNNLIDSDNYYSDFKILLNSNMDNLNSYKGITFGYRNSVDNNRDISDNYLYVSNDSSEYGITYLNRRNVKYGQYSTSENLLEMSDDSSAFYDNVADFIDKTSTVSKDDFIYAIQKERDILLSILDEKLISAENDEIEIDNDNYKVIRNSLTLEGNDLKQKVKKIREMILNDTKLLSVFKSYDEKLTATYLEDELKSIEDNIEEKDKLIINLYTTNGDKLVGVDIEYNGFVNYYIYFKDGNFDVHLNFSDSETCSEGLECLVNNKRVFDLIGKKEGNITLVDIKYNDNKIADLSITEFNDNKIDFDYKVYLKNENIFGDVFFLINSKEKNYNLTVNSNVGSNNINFNINLDRGIDSSFKEINTENVLNKTELNSKKEYNNFVLLANDSGLVESYDFWLKFMKDPLIVIKDLQLIEE